MVELLHLIKGEESTLAFHPQTYSILDLPQQVYKVLSLYQKGISIGQIALTTGYKEGEILNLLENLNHCLESIRIPKVSNCFHDKRHIYRITLHISNDCNLRCRYCYATGGNYNQKRELMSYSTADSFIDFCRFHFDQIENIVFFGGEPLLNIKIIDYVCNSFESLYEKGKINKMPSFGIITNGTIMNSSILKILIKHIKFITISIDGPEKINDANRVFPDGKGSYEKIISFINTIRKNSNISIKYEATYTDINIRNNITHTDLHKFFNSIGLEGIITDDINIKGSSSIQKVSEELKFSELELPEGFWSILSSIVYKEPKQMCQIIKKTFAVSTTGNIYACHMDNGIEEANMGNIFGKNIFNSPEEYIRKHPLIPLLDNKEKTCGGCWAINICAGCTRKWFFNKKNSRYEVIPNKGLCIQNRKHIERIILLISKIRKDKNLWEEFLDFVNQKKQQFHE